jgi:hypothetical protein
MTPEHPTQTAPVPVNYFTGADVEAILRERGWLVGREGNSAGAGSRVGDWVGQAAALLGPQASAGGVELPQAREKLAELLGLVFRYDAGEILASPESHAVLAWQGARELLRELAHLVLEGPEVDSDRLKEIVAALRQKAGFSGRKLFHPLRLALAGRAGEGELDRVILLLDTAAKLPFAAPVKGTRQRILEFCAALD